MKTLIGIQDEYIRTVNDGAKRWAHRKDGGHIRRIRRGAHTKAFAALAKLGFSKEAAERAIADAAEMAKLELISEE